MATTTINGITFEVSLDEMIALANNAANSVQVKPVNNAHAERVVKAIETGQFEVTAKCGHTVTRNSPRGRKPALCDDCKGSSGEDQAEPSKAKPERSNSKRGGFKRGNYEPTPLEEMPDDKPASENQITRIENAIKTHQVGASRQRNIRHLIKQGLSVRGAATIYRELKALPTR